jgi:DNA polymerase/3'-5' exonuclease PolX
MPKLLPPGAEDLIKLLSMDKLGPKAIKEKLKQLNLEVSLRFINNVIQCEGQKHNNIQLMA